MHFFKEVESVEMKKILYFKYFDNQPVEVWKNITEFFCFNSSFILQENKKNCMEPQVTKENNVQSINYNLINLMKVTNIRMRYIIMDYKVCLPHRMS